jgi:N-acetylgalactosamine 4-sulfate 6-O-sulfotransferase
VHPFDWYLNFFTPVLSSLEEAPSRKVFGDGSFATFTFTWTGSERVHANGWTKAFRQCREADCDNGKQPCVDDTCYAKATALSPPLAGGGAGLSLPWVMRAAHGRNAKFIVVLRDPVERLHAAFYFYEHYGRVYGADEAGFAKYVAEMTGHIARCLAEGHGEAACVTAFEACGPSYEAVFYHADQVLKSMYAVFMDGWMAAFPPEDVLVLRLEDYAGAGEPALRATLQRALSHLALSEPSDEVWARMLGEPVTRNGGALRGAPRPDMAPDTKQRLTEFFRPYNDRLMRLLDDDPKWLWA